MTPDTQQVVVDFLMQPCTHGGEPVERIDTHSAMVFLAGSRALKLKRAVRFDYLDFSTPARRQQACEAEVRLNRRTAPSLYRGVVAVTREADGALALGGRGEPLDWLVDMSRFDQAGLFDRLAAREALDIALMPPLAASIARLHRDAERRDDHGGRAGIQWVVDGNAKGFAEQGAGILDPEQCAELTARANAEIARVGSLLDARRRDGFVRQCHGDLHLRNIVLLDGVPTLFDAIEFNDEITCIDAMYDMTFLLMDLWRRHLRAHANSLFNAYLTETNDIQGLTLLPLFLSCRAAVRAKTSATAARMQPDRAKGAELEDLARQYLTMALSFLAPPRARLVAVGGLSGSGKSTLARALAPDVGRAPGAVLLRSDEVRKSLHGVAALEHLGPDAYTAGASQDVYRALRERAEDVLETGHSVVADAVFARPSDRFAVEQVAGTASVSFLGFWLDAAPEVLITRVERRGPDASDANADVVAQQLRHDPGPIAWFRLDAGAGPAEVADRALALVTTIRSGPRHDEDRTGGSTDHGV